MNNRNILLLVEGEAAEVGLFNKIFECFPQMGYSKDNIIVYKTNLWVLIGDLKNYFGDDWHEQKEINFLNYIRFSEKLKGQAKKLDGKKITDIYLVFDFERQDLRFNGSDIENMQKFFSDPTRNGMLYINYPMVEAYKHLQKPLPDKKYLDRICKCSDLTEYKSAVNSGSHFKDLRKLGREEFKQLLIHNLCKAACITEAETSPKKIKCISEETAYKYYLYHDFLNILEKQIYCSADRQTGFVYVLATCLFFISDYNPKLIFNSEGKC